MVRFERTGGVADSHAPHSVVLGSAHESGDTHTVALGVGSLEVDGVAAATGADNQTSPGLVVGAVYSISVTYRDAAGNPAASDAVHGVRLAFWLAFARDFFFF